MSTLIEIDKYVTNPYGYLSRLYTQTNTSTPVTNTIVESTLLDGGLGSLSVPANEFKVGDSFHAVMTGQISSGNNQPLNIRIKTNSVILSDTGTLQMATTTDKDFKLEVFFTVRAIGASGVAAIVTGGTFMYTKNAATSFEGTTFSNAVSTGFDTTILNTLDITAQWGNASASNIIYSEIFTLNKTY